MIDAAGTPADAAPPTAGRLLREAREKQGLHIAALAAAIKVPQKKLEMLEADRFSELLDATFTRALAQTVCRALKIDPAPVMRLLPPPDGRRLELVGEGLNTPFRDRPGALVQRDWRPIMASPMTWITLLILLSAIVVYALPSGLTAIGSAKSRLATAASAVVSEPASSVDASALAPPGIKPVDSASATPPGAEAMPVAAPADASSPVAAGAASEPAAMSTSGRPKGEYRGAEREGAPVSPQPLVVAAAPIVPAATPLAVAPLPVSASGVIQVRASQPSWVEVVDGRGKSLVARLLKPGEVVGLDGTAPFRLRIGNASGTQVVFRGQPTDLQAATQNNVARLELK